MDGHDTVVADCQARLSPMADERSAKRARTDELVEEAAQATRDDIWIDSGTHCGTCGDEFWPSSTGGTGVGQCSVCHGDICSHCFTSAFLTRACRESHEAKDECVNADADDDPDDPAYDKDADAVEMEKEGCRRGVICPKCVYKEAKRTVDESAFLRAKYVATVTALHEEGDL
jgi:hypothetical protein